MKGISTVGCPPELNLMPSILAAVDQSATAYTVFKRAVELTRLLNGELTVLSVVNSNPMMKTSMRDEAQKMRDFHRGLVFKIFPSEAVKTEAVPGQGTLYRCGFTGEIVIRSRIENGDPVERICGCAEEISAELVVVGNRGLGNVGTLVLGSVSEKVVRKSTRTVIVVKDATTDSSDWEGTGNAQRATQHLTR